MDLYDVWTVLDAAGAPTGSALVVGSEGEVYADVDPDHLRAVVRGLQASGSWHHLSALTAQPVDGMVELLYHFWCRGGVTLRVRVARGGSVPSLVGLLPGAAWYEAEARELVGIAFEDGPQPRPLLLPDDWDGPPPLEGGAEDGKGEA